MASRNALGEPLLPSYGEACRFWFLLGLLSFGGAAGQIALMHRLVVEERRWVGERRYLEALNYCTLLPGPEAQQLATYLGWLLHGVRGGLVAGTLFVLPGAALMTALSTIYALHGRLPLLEALFFGLRGAVLVIVAEALLNLSRRVLRGTMTVGLAVAAFLALFALRLPFPLVVLAAGAIGLAAGRAGLGWFCSVGRGHPVGARPTGAVDRLLEDPAAAALLSARSASALRAGLFILAGWICLVGCAWWSGGTFGDIALFFAKMAVLTFGGAYAVLAWVAQEAVGVYGWVSTAEMVDGLALAETTPGPTILVLQFVAFLAALRDGGLAAGVAGGLLCVIVTFAPSFAWIFLGGPSVERIASRHELASALCAITAAVVGVMANLALVLAFSVLSGRSETASADAARLGAPMISALDPRALAVVLAGAVSLFGFRLGLFRTLGVCAAVGLVLRLAT